MAESLGDKLKRIAAEKKAARELAEKQASAAGGATPEVEVSDVTETVIEAVAETSNSEPEVTVGIEDTKVAILKMEISAVADEVAQEIAAADIASRTTSDHPLSMQFAEMEQALLAADPTFKTILRDVHRQLGNDPELVTMMTEDEIQLVVRGLIVHAKAEIIEPAKAKTVKKEVAAAKKKVIGADDL